ncbi:MAG TPA: hypothetical protein VFN99_11580 [Gaiella sp.]|jgi:hypothetical protein|nr:hypothetical protein [Gaiella sp.]
MLFTLAARRTLTVILGVALLAASLTAAATAAPKPGFLPGTWVGTGTISGQTAAGEGPVSTFTGKLAFVMKVSPSGAVTGTGSWSRTMVGEGSISARIVAETRTTVAGNSTAPRLVGTYRAVGTFSGHGVTRTSTFAPMKLDEKLVITRAGKCRVTGKHTYQGVTTQWTAQLKGSGTCRA